ncbi:MCE family protein [Pectobacterium carotovorum subsp. carotovorum]|nr:MCE family protein [Pectobacterium carotovorum subsp. carotovorum]
MTDQTSKRDDPQDTNEQDALIVNRHRHLPSAIWLLPVVVVLVALSLGLHSWLNTGPLITIRFNSAEGLEVGKTQVQYKEVVVGIVEDIELGEKGKYVLVKARINKNTAYLANKESRFWVVRPRFGIAGPSGLGTLLSGAYIGVDAGKTQDSPRTDFIGLEVPPAVTNDRTGKRFVIYADTLGSLDIGSPVYYRKVQVGRVASYQLEPGGQRVALEVFIDAPNDQLVTPKTRFWNASGIDLSLNAEGLKLNTQSLATLVAGGLAFDEVVRTGNMETAKADTEFRLFSDQTAAYDDVAGPSFPVRMEFQESVRGLSINAPIEFQGLKLGKIERISLRYDVTAHRFISVVEGSIQPGRLFPDGPDSALTGTETALTPSPGKAETDNPYSNDVLPYDFQQPYFLHQLVQDGLRAQLKNGNLLTGQLYVSLVFRPDAPADDLPTITDSPIILPTVQGDMEQLQNRLFNIVGSLEKVPFGEIGVSLRNTLQGTDALMKGVNTQLTPEMRKTLQDARRTLNHASNAMEGLDGEAPLMQNASQTLQEVNRAARSVRILSDYLQAHPESLIQGRDSGKQSAEKSALPLPESDVRSVK